MQINDYVNELCLNISRADDGLFYNMSMVRVHNYTNETESKYDLLTDISETAVILNKSVTYCQHDNYTLGFSSSRVEVVHDVLHPRKEFILNATFFEEKFTEKSETNKANKIEKWFLNKTNKADKTKKWFLEYINLLVFIPVAILAGFVLICYQQRRHLAEKTFNAMKNNSCDCNQETTKFIKNSSERAMKSKICNKRNFKENGKLEGSKENSPRLTYIKNKTVIKLNQKCDESSQQFRPPKRVSFK